MHRDFILLLKENFFAALTNDERTVERVTSAGSGGIKCKMLPCVMFKLKYFHGPCFNVRIARNYEFRKWLHVSIIQTCKIYMSAGKGTSMKKG
jgi:hypothetical protein